MQSVPNIPRRIVSGRLALSIGAAAAAFGAIGMYVYWHRTAWDAVRLESPLSLAICAGGTIGALAIAGEIFRTTITRVGRSIGYWESLALAVAGVAIDTVFPLHGGAAFRGVYLRQRHGLPVAAFVAAMLGYSVLRLFTAAVLAFAASLWLSAGQPGLSHGLQACLWVAGACIVGAALMCGISPGVVRGIVPKPLIGVIDAFHTGWATIVGSRRFLVRLFLLTAAQLVCEMVAIWGAWDAVGARLGLATTAVVTCFGVLAGLAGFTPGGLGLTELVTVSVGSAVAVEPVLGIAASLLARGVNLGIIAIMSPVAFGSLGIYRRR